MQSLVDRGTTVRVDVPIRLESDGDDVAELALDATARNARTVRVPERALGRTDRGTREA